MRAVGTAAFGSSLLTGCVNPYRDNAEGDGKKNAPLIRFGMVTDLHYADANPRGTRFYRDSRAKLAECVELMNTQGVGFMIELGDFKDEAQSADKSRPVDEGRTLAFLRDIEKVFSGYKGLRYHVLGNHDTDSISREQFLGCVTNSNIARGKSYYSFDANGVHFVVLNACFAREGGKHEKYVAYDHGNFNWQNTWIPPQEMAWLKEDLTKTSAHNVIVFIHQLLDGVGSVYVNNASQVRKVLERSGKVRVVFQGHHHHGAYSLISGIHYYTLRAMVEGAGLVNNSCAVVDVYGNGDVAVQGYYKAVSKVMGKRSVR